MNAFFEILQIAVGIDPYTDELTGDERLVADLADLLDISEENVVENAGDSYSHYYMTYDGDRKEKNDSFWCRIFPHNGGGKVRTERTLSYTARAAIRERLRFHQANPDPSDRDYLIIA